LCYNKYRKEREVIKMTREKMMDNLIKKLGMEHKYVIYFCKICEEYPENEWNNAMIYGIYRGAMNHNWEEE
jgi:transcription initiation factor IIE alpha subunit